MEYLYKITVGEREDVVFSPLSAILDPVKFRLNRWRRFDDFLLDLRERRPDIVFLNEDLVEDAFSAVSQLRADERTKFIPIIMVIKKEEDRLRALMSGASDFILPPFSRVELALRLRLHLRMKKMRERLEEIERVFISVARAIEIREYHSGLHTERIKAIAISIGRNIGLGENELQALRMGAYLHDIGKIIVPERILLKPGRLTEDEFRIVKIHTTFGENLLKSINRFKGALPIIRHHHERWDGRGYPDGLEGEKIPLLARIVAIADAYDAMRAKRPYREAMSHEEAMNEIRREMGGQFDPKLVSLLEKVLSEDRFLKYAYNSSIIG